MTFDQIRREAVDQGWDVEEEDGVWWFRAPSQRLELEVRFAGPFDDPRRLRHLYLNLVARGLRRPPAGSGD